jgi:hypothetical protein
MLALLAYQNQSELQATFIFIAVLAVIGAFAVWRGWGL